MPRRTRSPSPSDFGHDLEGSLAHPMTSLNKDVHDDKEASTKLSRVRDYVGNTDRGHLPMPVLQGAMTSSSKRKKQKSARIQGGLRVHWERFRKRVGTGTAPSSSEREDTGTANSSVRVGHARMEEDQEDVDEVVVDRAWAERDMKTSVTHTDHEQATPEKSGGSHLGFPGTNTDLDSFAYHLEGFWASCSLLIILRWRLWPAIENFFWVRFDDQKSENHYRKELWFTRKSLALWSAGFFMATWIIGCIFIPKPLELADKIFYFGVVPVMTVPLPFLIMYDFPRDRPMFYQCYLIFSTWIWGLYQVFFLYFCGFYPPYNSRFTCGTKDFIGTFYYTTGIPTIALFGLQLKRFPALVGAVIFFVISASLVVPEHTAWVRNLLDFVVFHGFLLYVHFMREHAERRLYTLRDQLKIQFRATQKAQVNESKAADSKRRLTSYVFHEVRVPLNTALLAVQNMEATGNLGEIYEVEFRALEASLAMMSKVLNDVLDFNRLDSGRFESVSKPYAFHQAMRSLLIPVRLATDARKLQLITEFDPSIDEVAKRSMCEAMGDTPDAVARLLAERKADDGIVAGDEMRLRQIITNLASNACKFTPPDGKVYITTKLVLPEYSTREPKSNPTPPAVFVSTPGATTTQVVQRGSSEHVLSANHLCQHDQSLPKKPIEWIVVRIEVRDTGYGIPPKEMVQSKLFSAFNQTEQGRQQGGKGTGLGLALVRQIVKRSGGRLGVRSKVAEGSTFWVELPLAVGRKAFPDLTPTSMHEQYSEQKSFGFAKGSTHLTRPIDIEADPVISPTLQAMAGVHSIAESGNLAALILASRLEEADKSRHLAIDDNEGAGTHKKSLRSPPTPDSPNQQGVRDQWSDDPAVPLKLPDPAHAALSPTLSYDKVPDSSSTTEIGSEKTTRPTLSPLQRTSTEPFDGLPVLVVDDDPLTRTLMKRMLSRLGCDVSTAENGEVALQMITGGEPLPSVPTPMPTPSSENTGRSFGFSDGSEDHSKYAIVFLDNQMPVLSGVEAVRRLRQHGRQDLVIGVTGNALLTDQQEYLNAGVNHVLTKPVRERSLRNMLKIADQRRKRILTLSEDPSR